MKEVNKTICSYVLPSVASLLVTFMYIVVDSIFVGRGVGADALAAVNLALPFAALVTSAADLVAMGCASIAAIRLGRQDTRGAGEAASTGLVITLALATGICAIGMFVPGGIATVSGASARLVAPTSEYIFYYAAFAIFVVVGIFLNALVRNDGRPGLAFWGMIAGAAANIFLDWLFIFPFQMGIKGAAIASGIGQILTVCILLSHFVRATGRLRLGMSLVVRGLAGKICLRGIPEFITQISQPVTVLCFNFMVMRQLGEIGVSAYAVICNLTSLMFAVQTGVAAGMQSLFGRSYGEKNKSMVRYFYKAGIVLNLGAAVLLYSVLTLGGTSIIGLFHADAELAAIAADGLALYGLAFVLASVNITVTAFFLSTKRTGWAMLVAMARGCFLNIACIILLPLLLGGSALWASLLVVEILTIGLSLTLVKRNKNQRNPDSIVLVRRSAA